MKGLGASGHWWLYALLCTRGGIYVGISPTPARRILLHFLKRGAMYTRMNEPQLFLWTIEFASRSEAMRKERACKALARSEKLFWPCALMWQRTHQEVPRHPLIEEWERLRRTQGIVEQLASTANYEYPLVLALREPATAARISAR